jgi:hypothetical protein
MFEDEPEAAPHIRSFYEVYWARVRQNLWGEVHESVVPVLLGRFEHHVTICPDGVVVVLHRASSDSFHWMETSQSILELAQQQLYGTDVWEKLEVARLHPGRPAGSRFDLDVALQRQRDDEEIPFDRLQLRFVPLMMERKFWTDQNAEKLATRNLKGPTR